MPSTTTPAPKRGEVAGKATATPKVPKPIAEASREEASNDLSSEIISSARKGIVWIRSGSAAGTGFLVDGDLVVTDSDVIRDADSIVVTFFDGSSQNIARDALVSRDTSLHLALLSVRCPPLAVPLTLGPTPGVGDEAIAVSYANGQRLAGSKGLIRRVGVERGLGQAGGAWIEAAGNVALVAPGTPLLDVEGRVVGMASSSGKGQAPSLALSVEEIGATVARLAEMPAVAGDRGVGQRLSRKAGPDPSDEDGELLGQFPHAATEPDRSRPVIVISDAVGPAAETGESEEKENGKAAAPSAEPPLPVRAAIRYLDRELRTYPAKDRHWAGLSGDQYGSQRAIVDQTDGRWRIELRLDYKSGHPENHAAFLRGLIATLEEDEYAAVDLKLFADPARPELSAQARRGMKIRTKNSAYTVRVRPPVVQVIITWPEPGKPDAEDSADDAPSKD